ncbi:cupin domain-containing protein [Actinoplanes sp. NPDC049265]|uniref:cupin domain-containing protein n=1 Tax=Actinoplanes sp. NPDC049265 TaxID=3363902 RepID=UPI003720569D
MVNPARQPRHEHRPHLPLRLAVVGLRREQRLRQNLPELIHLPAHLGRHPELRATVDLLATELERPRLGTDAIIPALLDTLILHILRT